MNRRTAIRRLATFFLTTASCAEPEQPGKIYRIGFLSPTSASSNVDRVAALRAGLRDLG